MWQCVREYACSSTGVVATAVLLCSTDACFSCSMQSLRKVSHSPGLLRICTVVLLSYLPEAGQYSCFFLYLKKVSQPEWEGRGEEGSVWRRG